MARGIDIKTALKLAEELGFIGEEDVEGALNWVHPFEGADVEGEGEGEGADVEGDGGDVEGEGEAA